MFESLTSKLEGTFRKLRGQGKLNEKNIQDALKDVRMSLLEADVNFKVVKQFIQEVSDRAVGTEVMKSLTPGQQFIKIVHEEMIRLLGDEKETALELAHKPPVGIMVVGLQGSGKTTTCGKMAYMLKKQKRRPYLVPADVYRPAAISQLKTLAKQIGVDVWDTNPDDDPVDVVENALEYARKNGYDTLIVDTAGRLHIDDDMMEEIADIKDELDPKEILFVADAMTGQDAVQVAKTFNEHLSITGVVLTKMDGDARGGAALSIRSVTGKPVKLVGMGEKVDRLERFYPERIASRILGMGDVLSLIEKAQENIDQSKAEELQRKLIEDDFTLEDFLEQMKQIRKMGPITDLLGQLPGFGQYMNQIDLSKQDPEKQMRRVEAIILSMTPAERRNHNILNGSRRKRIARGSGTQVQEVNQLMKDFLEMKKMMRQFKKFGMFGGGGGIGQKVRGLLKRKKKK
ncbi:MAG: signal recognition particle protein [Myxococcales bacterium]|nr:signal recognition particle protein [Myxococcales bacterium]MCB9644950.1 signal recognition particle protein [Myxococcales bacterium]